MLGDTMTIQTHLSQTEFASLEMHNSIKQALAEANYQYCTPIQAESLPIALAGKDVASAGELMVFDGEILSHNRRSGHYKPSHEQHQQFISQLKESGVDISSVPEELVN